MMRPKEISVTRYEISKDFKKYETYEEALTKCLELEIFDMLEKEPNVDLVGKQNDYVVNAILSTREKLSRLLNEYYSDFDLER